MNPPTMLRLYSPWDGGDDPLGLHNNSHCAAAITLSPRSDSDQICDTGTIFSRHGFIPSGHFSGLMSDMLCTVNECPLVDRSDTEANALTATIQLNVPLSSNLGSFISLGLSWHDLEHNNIEGVHIRVFSDSEVSSTSDEVSADGRVSFSVFLFADMPLLELLANTNLPIMRHASWDQDVKESGNLRRLSKAMVNVRAIDGMTEHSDRHLFELQQLLEYVNDHVRDRVGSGISIVTKIYLHCEPIGALVLNPVLVRTIVDSETIVVIRIKMHGAPK